ncbi:hypothetical protein DRQ36_08310 [bacterium]|nr:MAG: hypothetical protein DRQ36_08310 [bacterium]
MIKRIALIFIFLLCGFALFAGHKIDESPLLERRVFVSLDSSASISDVLAGKDWFIICHKLGICGTGVLDYEAYFDSISVIKGEIPILFLFIGEDSLELRKFVNGYRTNYLKAGLVESDFASFLGADPPGYWPLLIISYGDSTILFNIPTPRADVFREDFLKAISPFGF